MSLVEVVGTIPRLVALMLFAAAGTIGLRSANECNADWPVIGASLLMLSWSIHWALRIAILWRRLDEARATRKSKRVQALGYAAAGVAFAAFAFRNESLEWWPFFVSMLFFWGCGRSFTTETQSTQRTSL
jgi:hypothetical protein